MAQGERVHLRCRSRRRCEFDPWVGTILWRRAWQPTPAFLLRKFPRTEEPVRLHFMGSLLLPHVLGNKLTQKDNSDSGVQFITLAGPRQSLLLAKDPDQFL